MLNIDRAKVEIEETVRWWGSDHKRTPLLVEAALGDGETIEDQVGTPDTEDDVEDGEEPERGWPRFDYGNGTCWFSIDPAPYLAEEPKQ